jgi:hypothetical protein
MTGGPVDRVEFIDWILFSTELLKVLRQIRDELQKIGDRLADQQPEV